MTIKKGAQWGSVEPEPAHLTSCSDERELGSCLERSELGSSFGLKAGSLLEAMGIIWREHSATRIRVSIDVVDVSFTDLKGNSQHVFAVGSAEIRRRIFTGELLVVSNTGHGLGRELLDRAHANDGKFDVLVVDHSMSIRQRFNAFRKIRTNSHLPHPKISYTQQSRFSWLAASGGRRRRLHRLYVDGTDFGRVQNAQFEVIPDAGVVYL